MSFFTIPYSAIQNNLKFSTNIKFVFLFILILFSIEKIYGQNYYFSRIFADRLQTNPALTGSTINPEININHQSTVFNSELLYSTYSFSYENYIEALYGGVGFHLISCSQAQGTVIFTTASLIYSYHTKIQKDTKINYALSIAYNRFEINANKLIFSDMINPYSGVISSGSVEFREKYNTQNIDFGTSAVLYSKKFHAGISLKNSSNLFFKENIHNFPPQLLLYFGKEYTFTAKNKKNDCKITLIPIIGFGNTNKFRNIFAGTYVKKCVTGFGIYLKSNFFPNSYSGTFFVELEISKKTAFSLAHERFFRTGNSISPGFYQISLRYKFPEKNKKSAIGTIYCNPF